MYLSFFLETSEIRLLALEADAESCFLPLSLALFFHPETLLATKQGRDFSPRETSGKRTDNKRAQRGGRGEERRARRLADTTCAANC